MNETINTIIQVGGISLSIISIVVTIVLFIISLEKKKPYYYKQSIEIISKGFIEEHKEFVINYREFEIQQLTNTKIALWNGGRGLISNSDIASSQLLAISAKENITVYGAKIIYQTEESCKFESIYDYKRVDIEFEYMGKNDGCVLSILHSGKSSDDLEITGTVKGTGPFQVNKHVFMQELRLYGFIGINRFKIFVINRKNIKKRLSSTPIIGGVLVSGLSIIGKLFGFESFQSSELLIWGIGLVAVGAFFRIVLSISSLPEGISQYFKIQ